MIKTKQQFTAVYKKDGAWYVGWIEEIPGANTQGKTLKETKQNLKEALQLVLAVNKSWALREEKKGSKLIREPLAISA